MNEENAILQNGCNQCMLEALLGSKKEVAAQSEEIGEEIQKRRIELVNLCKVEKIQMHNKSMIELEQECLKEKQLNREIIPVLIMPEHAKRCIYYVNQ